MSILIQAGTCTVFGGVIECENKTGLFYLCQVVARNAVTTSISCLLCLECPSQVTVAFDETSSLADVDSLVAVITGKPVSAESIAPSVSTALPKEMERDSPFLTHPIFNS